MLQGHGAAKLSPTASGMRNGTAPLEDSLAVLTYDPASTLRGIDLNELKTEVHTKTCIYMFI